MRVFIGISASILVILCLCLLVLPLTLTVFLVITAGSFIAFHLSQNPAAVSRALAHVRSLSASAPKFWPPRPEEETTRRSAGKPSLSPIYQPKLTDSIKDRGKENIVNYVRPTLKPRRFANAVEASEVHVPRKSPQAQQSWVPFKNSTAANFSTWSPRSRTATEGINLSTGYTFDDKLSFSRLPFSPIYPPNKSIDSPDLDLSSTMLRFNSGQDSLLHPSMHYPTHQPDLVTSPSLLPSVSWLKDGGLSSPRHRRGLPRVQSPVMVKIASPLPDRPASPLLRRLASESDKQKASSADKVIMAIKQRQKRTAQEANTETRSPLLPSDVRSESKRRKLDSTSGKDVARSDIDMDLDPLPARKQTDRVFWPSRYGITSPTPRNPIVSSFSSSRKSQSTLKRRMDTSSIEVEEEDGVSPIKRKVHPQGSQQSPGLHTPSKRTNTNQPIPQTTPGLSSLRSGSRALFLEKNTGLPSGSPSKDAGTTPQKSSLRGKLFTPKRTSFIPRVDTPGEYTAADNKEDRAQARQRGSYLKEMLMQETEEDKSKGAVSTTSAPTTNALFAGAGATTTTTASTPLPTFSVGSVTKSTESTTSAAPSGISATASTSSGGTPALGVLSTSAQKTSDSPLLSSGDKQKLTATSSEKTVKFGNATTPQLNLSSSASAASVGTSQKAGETSLGVKLPSVPSTGSSLLKVQETQQSLTLDTNSMGTILGGGAAGGTSVDAKVQSLSANNNAVTTTSQSMMPSAPISGGFTVGGSASIFGGSSTTAAPASSASTTTSSSKPQFPPIFGGLSASSGVQTSAGASQGKPSSQAQAGGFQFGQTLVGSTATVTAGGLSFGNTKTTSSVPSGLATPFQAAAHTSAPAPTASKQMFSMSAPNATAPISASSSAHSGGPQFPPIFGQQTPSKPATGLGQGAPSFGSATSQATPGGFKFGQSVPSTNTTATPQAFSFGGSTAAPTSSTSSSSNIFGSGQPATSFGASKPASAIGSSGFGSTHAPNQAPIGGATSNTSTMFGGATAAPQKPAFGATGNTSIFGSGSTPGATSASKPAFGNPTATVTPFGSGNSQPPAASAAAASPFQFGASQPKAPAQSSATGGFNFGGQATPQKAFGFGAPAPAPAPAPASNNGFQFGQTQPAGGATQQPNFFGGAAANTASPFGAGGGFGTPAPSMGNTPAPAFGASPNPPAAPAGGGFSVGTGGANPAANQRRMNRLRQVRNRSGRR